MRLSKKVSRVSQEKNAWIIDADEGQWSGTYSDALRAGIAKGKAALPQRWGLDPVPGCLYVADRAISSRCNANYDAWPPEALEKSWQTFLGSSVFVDHHNWDHSRSRGVIVGAKLHKDKLGSAIDDWWVEILIEIDAIAYPLLAKAIMEEEINSTSMGCDIDSSTCSICGNEAPDFMSMCDHVKYQKGQLIDGKLCFELCGTDSGGITFFENSFVFDPADESALISDFFLCPLEV